MRYGTASRAIRAPARFMARASRYRDLISFIPINSAISATLPETESSRPGAPASIREEFANDRGKITAEYFPADSQHRQLWTLLCLPPRKRRQLRTAIFPCSREFFGFMLQFRLARARGTISPRSEALRNGFSPSSFTLRRQPGRSSRPLLSTRWKSREITCRRPVIQVLSR